MQGTHREQIVLDATAVNPIGRHQPYDSGAVLDCRGRTVAEAETAASLVVQAAMSGTICVWPDVPVAVSDRLGPETAQLLKTPLPAPDADALDWDARGIRQRRAALREHAAGLAGRLPSVSVVLASSHPERLPRAIAQARAQSYPELELIAVEDDVPLVRAAECANGDLVTKFDANDTYGPEHVWDLVLAWHYSAATLVGKPDEFVYLEKLAATIRRTGCRNEHYSHWVAHGTILAARADLVAIGGSADRALLDRIAEAGGRIYRTHGLGYLYHRHAFGHTWNPELGYYLGRTGAHWVGLLQHPEFSAAGASSPAGFG